MRFLFDGWDLSPGDRPPASEPMSARGAVTASEGDDRLVSDSARDTPIAPLLCTTSEWGRTELDLCKKLGEQSV